MGISVKRKYSFKYGMPDGTARYEEFNVELDILCHILKEYTDYFDRGIITWWDYEQI